MVTKQPDYDVKPSFGTLLEKHRQLPFKRFIDVISAKVADVNDLLNRPAAADQHPGNIIPHAVPVLFGPLPLTTARRGSAVNGGSQGFELSAALANPAAFVTPRDGNMLVGRELSFQVQSLSVYGFVSFGYSADPGFTVTKLGPIGDIFDPVIEANGGAMPLDFFGATFSTNTTVAPDMWNINGDIELYDRLRGRRLHDAKLPIEMFQGGRMGHRKMASPIMFEKGSNVEPRLFINEIRMGSILDTQAVFDLALVKVWLCVLFKGRQFIEVPNT
jgi:hypothetical protein